MKNEFETQGLNRLIDSVRDMIILANELKQLYAARKQRYHIAKRRKLTKQIIEFKKNATKIKNDIINDEIKYKQRIQNKYNK